MFGLSGPGVGPDSGSFSCAALSRSLDTRRVSFGSVEVFGSPEISRSLDDIEAFRQVCKRKGVPLYSALPPTPPVTITGTSPSKVFPIFGFFFSPSQTIQTPPQAVDAPETHDVTDGSQHDDTSPEGASPSLSRASSSDPPSITAYSSSPSVLKSILKTTGSYKTSPGFLPGLGGCLNASCTNCKGIQTGTPDNAFPMFANASSSAEGLFTAQLPPRPTPKRSLLRQAVHNMQQANPAQPAEAAESAGVGASSDRAGWQEGGEQLQGNSPVVVVWGREVQNGRTAEECNGRDTRSMQHPSTQVMSYSSPAPVLRSYADRMASDAGDKQPLLGQEYQEEGDWEEEEAYEVELCSWCPPCMVNLLLGNGSTPSSKLIRI